MKQETIQEINRFRDERHWRQFHNPKDLAISISLEASELLELFQWKTNEEVVGVKTEQLQEELADIPVIFLTGRNDLESVQKVLSLKPAGYLFKAMNPSEIRKNIDTFFEKMG